MFKKILIANRGEISCRIIRTAKKMGVQTVAVYSDADREALHVKLADEAVHIGAAPANQSYLVIDNIINAAKRTGAEAIHPGYGFLSENAEFCHRCADAGIVFIGPPSSAIEAMGSKSAAKQIMEEAGVPLVPGYHGDDQSEKILKQSADAMGYPVLLKATAGGGGKGMRQVWSAEEFSEALAAAKREAMKSFSDDKMLVEKYLIGPRHVEFQVFCDSHGNAVHLFERDCSVQRRHQKVIEEAPAPGMTETLRAEMGEVAIRAAQAIDYVGAGTVEFLLDAQGNFYFMEMNTRLQVEHPVTEMISGQDLVAWQLKVASGEELPLAQHQLSINGHAFEARVYAEDPDNEFLPQTGTLHFLKEPEQNALVRVDSAVLQGDEISVYYDPMISKLITWGEDREVALKRLQAALAQYNIGGVVTNLPFLYKLSSHPAFENAELDTGFIETHNDTLFQSEDIDLAPTLSLAALYLLLKQQKEKQATATASKDLNSPWGDSSSWRCNLAVSHQLCLCAKQETYEIDVRPKEGGFTLGFGGQLYAVSGELSGDALSGVVDGHRLNATVSDIDGEYTLYLAECTFSFTMQQADTGEAGDSAGDEAFAAPMNGTIVAHCVAVDTEVEKGSNLVIMEAMKMEHTITAPAKGKVKQFFSGPGDLVDGGAQLLEFEVSE